MVEEVMGVWVRSCVVGGRFVWLGNDLCGCEVTGGYWEWMCVYFWLWGSFEKLMEVVIREKSIFG